jgi:sortase A
MTAPRLGAKWSETIYEGASLKRVLTPLGLGHYSMTQMPGEIGNFAIAGHRVGSGGPFRNIDKFRKGDVVVVRTKKATFTYRYLQTKVVMPSEVEILLPDPAGLTAPRTSESLLTLQTCTPIHVNTKRLIVWFELVRQN